MQLSLLTHSLENIPREMKRDEGPDITDWLSVGMTGLGLFLALGGIVLAIITGAVPLNPIRRRRNRFQAAVEQDNSTFRDEAMLEAMRSVFTSNVGIVRQLENQRQGLGPPLGSPFSGLPGPSMEIPIQDGRELIPPMLLHQIQSIPLTRIAGHRELIQQLQTSFMARFHYAYRYGPKQGTVPLWDTVGRQTLKITEMFNRRQLNPDAPSGAQILGPFTTHFHRSAMPHVQGFYLRKLKEWKLPGDILYGRWEELVEVVGPLAYVVMPQGWTFQGMLFRDYSNDMAIRNYYYNIRTGDYSDERPPGGWLFDLSYDLPMGQLPDHLIYPPKAAPPMFPPGMLAIPFFPSGLHPPPPDVQPYRPFPLEYNQNSPYQTTLEPTYYPLPNEPSDEPETPPGSPTWSTMANPSGTPKPREKRSRPRRKRAHFYRSHRTRVSTTPRQSSRKGPRKGNRRRSRTLLQRERWDGSWTTISHHASSDSEEERGPAVRDKVATGLARITHPERGISQDKPLPPAPSQE